MLIKLKFCHVHALRLNRGCMKVYYLFIFYFSKYMFWSRQSSQTIVEDLR